MGIKYISKTPTLVLIGVDNVGNEYSIDELKDDCEDLYQKTADEYGITREQAKKAIYCSVYGDVPVSYAVDWIKGVKFRWADLLNKESDDVSKCSSCENSVKNVGMNGTEMGCVREDILGEPCKYSRKKPKNIKDAVSMLKSTKLDK